MSSGRIAVVTGGMGGLGEAIAERLLSDGFRVVVTHSLGNDHVAT
ncbi:MAG TPA: beta-ketoacyl-ACP reductase, partial [Cupriavidus sp.]|nr:beta-ketoacyl-ACP reductase [Cupriavidus sp.]